MAKFYPAVPQTFNGSDGEKVVYDALKMLDDEYIVFQSYRWMGRLNEKGTEGEADFIVFHPLHGILCIEVKSGEISYRDGVWHQINQLNGVDKEIHPMQQADATRFHLIDLLKCLNQQRPRYHAPLIGSCVWFPSCIIKGNAVLPQEIVPELALDMDALAWPEKALQRAYDYYWGKLGWQEDALTVSQLQKVMDILMPAFHLVPKGAAVAKDQEEDMIQLTHQQYALLHYLAEQPVAGIHGAAGTGKTVLALEKARMLASEGKQVLYLCFNEFLYQSIKKLPLDAHITVHNERTLAEELMPDKDIPLEQILQRFETFFAEEYEDESWPYPHIIVDEAQDFPASLLEHLYLLTDMVEGTFYVFYDRKQTIIARREGPDQRLSNAAAWIDKNIDCRLVLYRNCRNTSAISNMVRTIGGVRNRGYVNAVPGLAPRAVFVTDKDGLKRAAGSFINRMQKERFLPEEIAVLTVSTEKKSCFAGMTELGGNKISHKPEAGHILFTTVRKYKGLEAKAVLLVDIQTSQLPDENVQHLIYVGASRASSYLELVFLDDVPRSNYPTLMTELQAEEEPTRKGLEKWLGIK